MGNTRTLFFSLVFSLLASVEVPGEVLTVGPAGAYTEIQAAVDAADDGDTILVASGTYSHFVINNKGLYITADLNAYAWVSLGVAVYNLSENQTLVLRGLGGSKFFNSELLMLDNQGAIRIENCYFGGRKGDNKRYSPNPHPDGYAAATLGACEDVSFSRCIFRGGVGPDYWDFTYQICAGSGGHCLEVEHSTVVFYDCTGEGGDGGCVDDTCSYNGRSGGTGIKARESYVFASSCSFQGGDGGYGGDEGLYTGPGDGGDGGNGIYLWHSEARLLDNDLQGGTAGQGGSGYPWEGSDGLPGRGVKTEQSSAHMIPFSAQHFEAPSPLRENETIDMIFTGDDNALVFLLVARETGSLFVRELHGQLLLQPGPELQILFMGRVPRTGPLIHTLRAPWLKPGIDAKTYFCQPIYMLETGEYLLGTAQILQVVR